MAKKQNRKMLWVPPAKQALQLKVALRHIRPPIWRRVVVPDNFTLGHLHTIIQVVMGWENSHMHAFRFGAVEYTSEASCAMGGMGMENEESVFLQRVVSRPRQKFLYEYDFGDSWVHEVVVEKLLPLDPQAQYPVCLAGARACPPEDCGSFPGYFALLEALKASKKTAQQKGLLEWLGAGYDPERFDLDGVNRCLTGL